MVKKKKKKKAWRWGTKELIARDRPQLGLIVKCERVGGGKRAYSGFEKVCLWGGHKINSSVMASFFSRLLTHKSGSFLAWEVRSEHVDIYA